MTNSEIRHAVNEWCAKVINLALDAGDHKGDGIERPVKFELMAREVAEGILARNSRKKGGE